MEKKFFIFIAIFFACLFPLVLFFFRSTDISLVLAAIFLCSMFYILAAEKFKAAVFIVVLLFPMAHYFNYYRISLPQFFGNLGLSNIEINSGLFFSVFIISSFFFLILSNPKFHRTIPFIIPLFAAILFFSLSLYWTSYISLSIPRLIFYITPLFIYFLGFYLVKSVDDFFETVHVIILSSLIPVFFGFYQILTTSYFYEPDSALGRLTGTFTHPNNFGAFLFVIISILIIYLSSISRKKSESVPFSINFLKLYLLILLIFFLLTYSRIAWLSLLVFIFLFYVQNWKKFLKIGLIVAAAIAIIMIFKAPRERLTSMFERSAFDSIYARETINSIAINKFYLHPLLGYGIGTFEPIVQDVRESYDVTSWAHNNILLFILEGGIVGASLYIIYTFGLIIFTFRNWLYHRKYRKINIDIMGKKAEFSFEIFSRGIFVLLLSLAFAGLGEATATKVVSELMVWFLLGSWFSIEAVCEKLKKT